MLIHFGSHLPVAIRSQTLQLLLDPFHHLRRTNFVYVRSKAVGIFRKTYVRETYLAFVVPVFVACMKISRRHLKESSLRYTCTGKLTRIYSHLSTGLHTMGVLGFPLSVTRRESDAPCLPLAIIFSRPIYFKVWIR